MDVEIEWWTKYRPLLDEASKEATSTNRAGRVFEGHHHHRHELSKSRLNVQEIPKVPGKSGIFVHC